MAAEGKAPSLAEEYSLPPQEVQLQNPSEEKSAASTVAEVVPEKSAETPPANEATVVVEETSETPEVKEASEEPEAEASPAAEESSEAAEESSDAADETADEKPEIMIETAPADFRFPTTNQTRHCFTRYVEYHRCVAAKGEGAPECEKFAKYYRSLCPSEWVERWNEQRENGTFPGPL
ncbi:cytochrome c oxidase subunit 6b-1-like [Panicum virgatum]|uniref:Cytochrome c oxidase subunit n=1 Tax=Panicum virgatum TaxID=38727 RepID=A0A8T0WBI1_PANVG|nr:cytochrome c oxidase subunit 6b-1-like [Panicum virgatum]KAG2646881.1 hypothetical protein PVAP13_2KG548800 [Panicum virgatum]